MTEVSKKLQELKNEGLITNEEVSYAKLVLYAVDQQILIADVSQYIDWEKLSDILLFAGLIERDYDTNILRSKLSNTTEQLTAQEHPLMDDFDTNLDRFRAVWSVDEKGTVGLRIGAMGDKHYLKKKMQRWFKVNSQYTWEDVIKTARAYVHSQAQSNYKYLQSADYFVEKDSRSRLSAMIDTYKNYEQSAPGEATEWNKKLGN